MYRIGRRIKRKAWPYIISGLIALAVIIVIIVFALTNPLKANTTLISSSPRTSYVPVAGAQLQHITKDIFSMDLPADWKAAAKLNVPYTVFSWQGGTTKDAGRRLDVYLDNLPTQLAANRLLPVRTNGDQISIIGQVSDNCVSFTEPGQSNSSDTALAKWDGVNFLCDTGNYERDVVAIGSAEGINEVTLSSPQNGQHRVLLVYTDDTASPDYTIFTSIVSSFRIL